MNEMVRPPLQQPAAREPAVNAPTVVLVLLALMAIIQLLQDVLPDELVGQGIVLFAFLPVRYDAAALGGASVPGGAAADIWTFVTYALLHGGWTHLVFNGVWMLAFGSAVAWRFGSLRFLAFSAACAAAGAALHLAGHWGQPVPMVGASAAISGQMAAAIRFMFQPGAPLGLFRVGGRTAFRVPAQPLASALRDRRVLTFLAVWFAVNLITGLGMLATGVDDQDIAWQAHIGGFLAGLVLFPLFDPVRAGDPRGPAQAARDA